ncbi:Integrase [uncultured Candidatus Thioglobus sp.]|nr:Integrase [uncultured Candidatus Thioglobus sp.]
MRGRTVIKKVKELTPIAIRTLSDKGRYPVDGVSELYLQVRPSASKYSVIRTVIGEKRRDIGLGAFPNIPLTDVRIKARHFKELILSGIDPVQQTLDTHQAQSVAQRSQKTLHDIACECHVVKKQGFKNTKHAKQWIGTVKRYAFDVLGDMDISRIGVNDVLLVLKPIWGSKAATASRLRQRLEAIFDHAITSGIRTTINPAQWKGCLKPLLAAPESVKKKQGKNHNHHAVLPVSTLSEFFNDLTQYKNTRAQALALCILTGARSGEVRDITWDELDIPNKAWRIDAQRMKVDKTMVRML